jgi:hypothetical protein
MLTNIGNPSVNIGTKLHSSSTHSQGLLQLAKNKRKIINHFIWIFPFCTHPQVSSKLALVGVVDQPQHT